ncbi:MAG TPA: hypothetical protein VFF53_13800 [Geobacteraceae bacterium]|nr:hypothetical protein [Geobacteraceae bacterium]
MGCTCESHNQHICQLTLLGLHDQIRRITDNPVVQCRQCGAKANGIEYLCAAHLLDEAPNVEGGHGSVGLDEVGKPHAG